MAIAEFGVMGMLWLLGIVAAAFKFTSKDRSKASKKISKLLQGK